MAYNEDLANSIRKILVSEACMSEKKMFGGLAFLINGNMAIAASGQGGILVHVNPSAAEELLSTTRAEAMEMRGHLMRGWLRVKTEDILDDEELASWVKLGVDYAQSLPPKL